MIMRELNLSEIAGVAGGSAVQDPNNPWWQLDKAEPKGPTTEGKGPTTEGIVGAGLMSAVCAGTGGVGAVLCGVATYIGVETVSAWARELDRDYPAPTITTPDGTPIGHDPYGVFGIPGNGYTNNSVVGTPGGLPSALTGNTNH